MEHPEEPMLAGEAGSTSEEVAAKGREVGEGAAAAELAAACDGDTGWGAAARGPPRVRPSYHNSQGCPGERGGGSGRRGWGARSVAADLAAGNVVTVGAVWGWGTTALDLVNSKIKKNVRYIILGNKQATTMDSTQICHNDFHRSYT